MKIVYLPCAGITLLDSFYNSLSKIYGKEDIIRVTDYNNEFDWNQYINSIIQTISNEVDCDDYIFVGCSLGAILAYELCSTMQKDTNMKKPLLNIMISAPMPNLQEYNIDGVSDFCMKEIANIYHNANSKIFSIMRRKLEQDLTLLDKYVFRLKEKLQINSHIIYSAEDNLVSDIFSWSSLIEQSVYSELSGGHFLMFSNQEEVLQLIKKDIETVQTK